MKAKGHVFTTGAPRDVLERVLDNGSFTEKRKMGFFQTHEWLAQRMRQTYTKQRRIARGNVQRCGHDGARAAAVGSQGGSMAAKNPILLARADAHNLTGSQQHRSTAAILVARPRSPWERGLWPRRLAGELRWLRRSMRRTSRQWPSSASCPRENRRRAQDRPRP